MGCHVSQPSLLAEELGNLQGFCGFACKYFPLRDPSLFALYTNPNLLSNFLSFLLVRQNLGNTIYSHTGTANKVLDFLLTEAGFMTPAGPHLPGFTCPIDIRMRLCCLSWTSVGVQTYDPQDRANITAVRQWMVSLSGDAKKARPSKQLDYSMLQQDGRWMEAPQFYAFTQRLMMEGNLLLPCSGALLRASNALKQLSWCTGAEVAKVLTSGGQVSTTGLDALQAGVVFPLLFGNVGTIRPSAMYSLQHPDYTVSFFTCQLTVVW